MELAEGIEPATFGLQNRCSTVELRQRRCSYPIVKGVTYARNPTLWRAPKPVISGLGNGVERKDARGQQPNQVSVALRIRGKLVV